MKKFLSFVLGGLVIIFLVLIYSRFVGTIGLKTNEINLDTNIAISYDGLKVVHFSDLHYKKVIIEKRVQELVKEINKIRPDVVLFTGDLLDKDYPISNGDINFLIDELSKIETKYGSYAILGDHDIDNEEILKNIYIQCNFTLLKNESTLIYNENNDKILISGLDSYLSGNVDLEKVMTTLPNSENISYQIMLIHEPDYIPTILKNNKNISLILSGHSIHGSMNIPLLRNILLPTGAKNYNKSENHQGNTDIFISNGIGVNQINFRLFNTPSINFYRINRES